jgi:serine/threonine protein kinase/Tol biopolymer transport system component
MRDRWRDIERLYYSALQQAPEARGAFVAAACEDDDELRAEVESLLGQPDCRTDSLTDVAPRRIGDYEISGMLGAGGMGLVYRATDLKLGREVAIKILPPIFAANPERLARFQREAQVLASLNHPNVGGIYGLEDRDGTKGLILELVPGETLAERIARGPLPIGEALHVAKQIADALDAAHQQGIVHRDLKPANIKVTPAGVVKVLDFGLAKLARVDGAESATPRMATPMITSPAAVAGVGVWLGTAAYMSPEQAKGREADKRSDIWAFGAVLYEMVTARRAFDAPDVASTIAKVLETEPRWDDLTAPVQRLLRRCLEKDPKKRLRDIGDAWDLLSDQPESESAMKSPARARVWVTVVAVAAAVLLAAISGAALTTWFRSSPPHSATFTVPVTSILDESSLAVSPDGARVAFTAGPSVLATRHALFIRALNGLEPQRLAGTDGAFGLPFWSPDGNFIVYADARTLQLKRVSVSGGAPETIASIVDYGGGTWNTSGDILISEVAKGIKRIPAAGGEPIPVTAPNGSAMHVLPSFLPDGRHFLFVSVSTLTVTSPGFSGDVYLGSIDGSAPVRLLAAATSAVFADGYLLFTRDGALMSQRFDPAGLTLEGRALRLPTAALALPFSFSASSTTLAYVTESGKAPRQLSRLMWYSGDGRQLTAIGEPATYGDFSISPNGKRVAAHVHKDGIGASSGLWMLDATTGESSQFTFGSSHDFSPIWSGDGESVVFVSNGPTSYVAYEKRADGASLPERVRKIPDGFVPNAWSGNRTGVIAATEWAQGKYKLWGIPLASSEKRLPLNLPEQSAYGAAFSRDGRWLAYSVDPAQPGAGSHVFVRSYPELKGPWRVSANEGGNLPRWSPDGRRLYYMHRNRIMVADVEENADTFKAGTPRVVLQTLVNYSHQPGEPPFDVANDGRILVNEYVSRVGTPYAQPTDTAGAASFFTVVLNWPATIRK